MGSSNMIHDLPNCSFFMAATYFSSRERRMERGLGRLDTFLEDSTSFLSGEKIRKSRVKKEQACRQTFTSLMFS